MTTILRVGDTVLWSGAWGTQEPRHARVTVIELVEPGQRDDGVAVDVVPWSAVEREVVVTLDNGHWAYGYQIRPVQPEAACSTAGAPASSTTSTTRRDEPVATSRECEECAEVRRCRMYMDDTGPGHPAPIYLCAPCARDHGFLPDPARAVPPAERLEYHL